MGLGGGVIIFMSAALAGLEGNVVRRTLNFQAPIVILPPEQVARPLRGEAPRLRSRRRCSRARSNCARSTSGRRCGTRSSARRASSALTPVVSGPGFALRGDASRTVAVTGIEPETYFHVIALDQKIVAGRHDLGPTDIIIGIELAKDLGADVGDKLRLVDGVGGATTRSR